MAAPSRRSPIGCEAWRWVVGEKVGPMKRHSRTRLGVFTVLVLAGVAAAEHHPSQKHLKRAACLEQCAADIAAQCVPHHHFHQCRGTLIRACQHREPGACVTTTTTTTTATTTTTVR